MKPTIIILATEQYGYYTDAIYYVKYLSEKFKIVYISWDNGIQKCENSQLDIVYVSRKGGPFRVFRYIREIFKHTTSINTIIFIKHIKFISSITRILFPKNKVILDIRSSNISTNAVRRFLGNYILKSEASHFKYITIINESLAEKLNIKSNYKIIPIGAEKLSSSQKTFVEMNLLYIGTLYNRHLEKVISGFAIFYNEYKDKCPLRLTIIGTGKTNEISILNREVEKLKLSNVIEVLGWISHKDLKPYLDAHNFGISWIPLTSYYDIQPATKTFEYLFSGLPVLATKTSANMHIINPANGVLTGDTSNDCYQGLVELYNNRSEYNSDKIRATVLTHSWQNVTKTLLQYIESHVKEGQYQEE